MWYLCEDEHQIVRSSVNISWTRYSPHMNKKNIKLQAGNVSEQSSPDNGAYSCPWLRPNEGVVGWPRKTKERTYTTSQLWTLRCFVGERQWAGVMVWFYVPVHVEVDWQAWNTYRGPCGRRRSPARPPPYWAHRQQRRTAPVATGRPSVINKLC